MHLLDSALGSAADFLAAADRTARTRAGLDIARRTLSNANRPDTDQAVYDRYLANYDQTLRASMDAISEAESACARLRLLVPDVADSTRPYLDLCLGTDALDEARADRERAREIVEDVIRRYLQSEQGDAPPAVASGASAQISPPAEQPPDGPGGQPPPDVPAEPAP